MIPRAPAATALAALHALPHTPHRIQPSAMQASRRQPKLTGANTTLCACRGAVAWPNCARQPKTAAAATQQQRCSDPEEFLHAPVPGCLQPAQVEASFSTLLDDEDEFEYEEGDEAVLIVDDIDETLLVDNLGLSDEVRS